MLVVNYEPFFNSPLAKLKSLSMFFTDNFLIMLYSSCKPSLLLSSRLLIATIDRYLLLFCYNRVPYLLLHKFYYNHIEHVFFYYKAELLENQYIFNLL